MIMDNDNSLWVLVTSVFQRLLTHQSVYWQFHSTETAVLIVHSDIVRATDSGLVSALVLLDLSAAFDMVDNCIVLDVLSSRFGVIDRAYGSAHI